MEDGCGDVWDIANFVFEQKKGCLKPLNDTQKKEYASVLLNETSLDLTKPVQYKSSVSIGVACR